MQIRLLHTNDLHGTLTPQLAEKLRPLRASSDLYFDSGDSIKTGNLGIPIRQEPVWHVLADLNCTASVLGNRETHVLEAAFHSKIRGASHPILCANLFDRKGNRPLKPYLLIEKNGLKIGVVGVMVPMVTERMRTKAASAYLWTAPIPAARDQAEVLRPHVDVLILLSHLGFNQDQMLVSRCPDYDLILGGHSHTVLEQPLKVGSTWICQGGSHGRYAGVYEWQNGAGLVKSELVKLA